MENSSIILVVVLLLIGAWYFEVFSVSMFCLIKGQVQVFNGNAKTCRDGHFQDLGSGFEGLCAYCASESEYWRHNGVSEYINGCLLARRTTGDEWTLKKTYPPFSAIEGKIREEISEDILKGIDYYSTGDVVCDHNSGYYAQCDYGWTTTNEGCIGDNGDIGDTGDDEKNPLENLWDQIMSLFGNLLGWIMGG